MSRLQRPDTSVTDQQAVLDRLQRLEHALNGGTGPTLYTSATWPPTTPLDAQEIEFLADAVNGVIWRFRYRATSASAYKWEFVGGSSLYSEVANDDSTGTSGSYVALANSGPSVMVPLTGDYQIAISAGSYNVGAATTNRMSYDIGAAGAVDVDSIQQDLPGANDDPGNVTRERRKTGLAASTMLVAKYKGGAVNSHWVNRWMRVTPVRVG